MLKVYKKPCKNCLFSDDRIVSQERAKDIIEGCLQEDTYFICHKASMSGDDVCCNRFFAKHKKDVAYLRISAGFGWVQEVDFKDNEKLTPYGSDE